jgi:hypothetical protein
MTSGKGQSTRDTIRAALPDFRKEVLTSLAEQSRGMAEKEIPERLILLTMASFNDSLRYSVSAPGIRILALGDWERFMAPPSLLEFFITLTMRHAVALVSPSLSGDIHLGTKGCLFDFTPILGQARLKTLQGFVCNYCRKALSTDGHDQLAEELIKVLDTHSWLGKSEEPTTPAGIVAKLGYDLFLTRGVTPTLWEKVQASLREEGVKEFVKIVGGIILAALVIWLGLKKGGS